MDLRLWGPDIGRVHRHKLRPDAHVAHRAAATRCRRDRRRSHPASTQAGRRTAHGCRRRGPHSGADAMSTATIDKASATVADHKWTGRYRDYDLVKEFVIALVVVSVLTVVLAALFSSPDEKQINISQWSKAAPSDFVATAATELDGTSGTATYGAPYTHDA